MQNVIYCMQVRYTYAHIYIYIYIYHIHHIHTHIYIHHRYRFIYCLFSLLISQGKWLKNVIGQQLRTEWCASAGQHLRHKSSHASSEFARPFKPPWVCGDGGGSRPWKCVLGHGPMWGPTKHGWASGLVLIAMFEAQSFSKAEWKSMPQMLSSEIWTRELYMYIPGTN